MQRKLTHASLIENPCECKALFSEWKLISQAGSQQHLITQVLLSLMNDTPMLGRTGGIQTREQNLGSFNMFYSSRCYRSHFLMKGSNREPTSIRADLGCVESDQLLRRLSCTIQARNLQRVRISRCVENTGGCNSPKSEHLSNFRGTPPPTVFVGCSGPP